MHDPLARVHDAAISQSSTVDSQMSNQLVGGKQINRHPLIRIWDGLSEQNNMVISNGVILCSMETHEFLIRSQLVLNFTITNRIHTTLKILLARYHMLI